MIKNSYNHNGLFITLEGGEGAGKTTLLNQLQAELARHGFEVVCTREPGGTPFGERLRAWLLTKDSSLAMSAKAELLLFLADRMQHIDEVIAPALKAGKAVICDRFNDSTIAYQGGGRELGVDWVHDLCKNLCGSIVPDISFYLDVTPEIGLSRTLRVHKKESSSGKLDRIEAEKLEFHMRVREAFQEIARKEPKRFYRIDANQTQSHVKSSALSLLNEHLQHVR